MLYPLAAPGSVAGSSLRFHSLHVYCQSNLFLQRRVFVLLEDLILELIARFSPFSSG
jgi:hypothetical protein